MDTIHTESDVVAKNKPAIEAAAEYWTDAWQRSFLTLEALNERGNIHLAQAAKDVPNVLNFDTEFILTGVNLGTRSITDLSASFRPGAAPSIP